MSLGRGHQRRPRSTFFICFELNELEELTRESTIARLGQDGKKLAEITNVGRGHWAEITVDRGHMYPYSFEYLCYGSTTVINIFTLTECGDRL